MARQKINTAYILGNGPTLPADLGSLSDRFTIGVNRITLTGFHPNVHLWMDTPAKIKVPEIARQMQEAVDISLANSTITVTTNWPRSVPATLNLGARGAKRPKEDWRADRLYSHYSSAGAAARLAWSWGFNDIIMLGCSAARGPEGEGHWDGTAVTDTHLDQFQIDRALLKEQLGAHIRWEDECGDGGPPPPQTYGGCK